MKKRIKGILIFCSVTFLCVLSLLALSPAPPLLDDLSFSKAVYDEQHQLLRMTLNKEDKYRLFTPLNEISPELIEATLLQEDQYFYSHYGVNPVSLAKALWQTYGAKSRRVGASTITMQLARIRYGIHSKKVSGKLQQMIKAVQLEWHYSKDQLLEAYLNLAPYGGNIEGVGAASQVYFNHSAKQLTLPESLTLSVIPQNPGKRTPHNLQLKDIRNRLYARWLIQHPKDSNKRVMFDLPLVMHELKDLPFKAPHFVNQVLNDASLPQSVHTSLDLRTQALIERITRHYLARKKGLGVYNAAVLLVDTRDMSIKSLMGSADFFNQHISGQINGVYTKRSPGSTLKPFIYALAIDQGLIHPNTMLKDVPHSFNGYNPENFDYDFMGPVKARDALVLSRNIPAIYLASQLNNPTLYQLLEQAEVSPLRSESYYGLSLSLGGVELSMNELVSLYAMLVNEGLWYPIHYAHQGEKPRAKRLLTPEASFLVLDMLKKTPRSDVHANQTNKAVSWKTGTSSGFRDAWTVGSFGPYVMAVWIGNFDNKSNPAFVGKDIAAPLFFELVEGIKQERGPLVSLDKDPEHLHLEKVDVCRASGMLPTRYCVDTEPTWFIPGVSPIKTDTIFREVAINGKNGLRTCHIDEMTRFEIFEFWPSDILAIFKKAGIQRRTPPFFEEDCTLSSSNGMSPQILSPQKGINYIIRANSKHNNRIPLTGVTDAGVQHLYWFINETFLAKTKPEEAYFWHAKSGHYVVRVVDDHGLSDARDINIELDS